MHALSGCSDPERTGAHLRRPFHESFLSSNGYKICNSISILDKYQLFELGGVKKQIRNRLVIHINHAKKEKEQAAALSYILASILHRVWQRQILDTIDPQSLPEGAIWSRT